VHGLISTHITVLYTLQMAANDALMGIRKKAE